MFDLMFVWCLKYKNSYQDNTGFNFGCSFRKRPSPKSHWVEKRVYRKDNFDAYLLQNVSQIQKQNKQKKNHTATLDHAEVEIDEHSSNLMEWSLINNHLSTDDEKFVPAVDGLGCTISTSMVKTVYTKECDFSISWN